MNGRNVMRASALATGILLSRVAWFDATQWLLTGCLVLAGVAGWGISRLERRWGMEVEW